ncbi:MAG: GGDEF domain-containing protein [Magnetococcales bacterium]|nr:GGDEF domain-containing protein [Magnetococcales bacterium]
MAKEEKVKETYQALDRLYDLLKADPPNVDGALRLLKELLRREPCRAELDAAREAAVLLVTRLLKPLTACDRDQDSAADQLMRHLKQVPQLQPDSVQPRLQALSDWVSQQSARLMLIRDIPEKLPERLFAALRLLGASEPWMVQGADKLAQEQAGKNAMAPDTVALNVPWEGLHTLLGQIVVHKDVAQNSWEQERRELKETLLVVAERLNEALQNVGRTNTEITNTVQRLRDDEQNTDLQAMRAVLIREANGFLGHAQKLSRQMEESRGLLVKAQERLRQTDEELRETRDPELVDVITGLPTRLALWAHLRRGMERAVHLNEPMALMVMQLQKLGALLREKGNEKGQRLLSALVKRIRPALRSEDILGRLSEEQFAIVLPNGTVEDARRDAERIYAILEQIRSELGVRTLLIQPAFGAVQYDTGVTEEQMMTLAEQMVRVALSQPVDTLRLEVMAPPHTLPA